MKLKTVEFEKDGETYEKTETEIVSYSTERGFSGVKFLDRSNGECSIQDSSLATEPAIWIGQDNPLVLTQKDHKKVDLSQDYLILGRMHLTQEMVKQILPILTEFAETGNYLSQLKCLKK